LAKLNPKLRLSDLVLRELAIGSFFLLCLLFSSLFGFCTTHRTPRRSLAFPTPPFPSREGQHLLQEPSKEDGEEVEVESGEEEGEGEGREAQS
jgi:hypothetical protein